ncbi:MAG TPA: MBL fold metallo-hydrolase [Candidatus Limnocylindria bacterium]|nr:MBL fold metallo-hydrolase [Candidatus Limnocylindria bacterium]
MIAPGILSVETRTADGKAGVIVGSRSALAVDAGIDASEGARVAAAARAAGRSADLLLFTHGHGDHVLGGSALPDAVVFAHADAERHIRAQIPTWASAASVTPAELTSRLALPVVTFTGELAFDLGGRHVRVLQTPGHAPGAVCVFVPEDGVLFGGDTVVTGIPPVFRDGDSRTLEHTLRELAGLGAAVLVPGHGAVVIGADRVREAMLWAADYLARVRERVSAALGQSDAETIVRTAAPYEALIGDRLPSDRHRMVWRHEQTVRYMIAELGAP